MKIHWSKRSAILAMLTLFVACATKLRAQDSGSMTAIPPQAAQALTGRSAVGSEQTRCAQRSEVIFPILPLQVLLHSATQP
jgi:hypothetical protein